jgi:predicted alpha/beta-hydrolase family hydrolase
MGGNRSRSRDTERRSRNGSRSTHQAWRKRAVNVNRFSNRHLIAAAGSLGTRGTGQRPAAHNHADTRYVIDAIVSQHPRDDFRVSTI